MTARKRVWNPQLHSVLRILGRINALAPRMKELSDAELQNETPRLKARLEQGETTDQILPEAFAAIREAAGRVLHMFPYDVQVMGGIVLHQGKIAEMKTGEGKTLVATLPLYLNALTGKGCFLVTMNSYLAVRDGNQMAELFNWMGLSLGIGCNEHGGQMSNARKKQIYDCDIVYTTSSALGFDYLLDNLVTSPKERYMRPFNYVIIDEADSVLMDMAMTPLIISGAPRVQSNLYGAADSFVATLTRDEDLKVEDKSVWLTDEGVAKAQRYFRCDNIFDEEHIALMRHINLALHAHFTLELNKDYVVREGKVQLLDSKTARILENNKLENGLHEALEAKEHVALTKENRSMASITYQSLFNMFPKASGMTGTGIHDRDELRQTYGMDVIVIPTNNPVQRIDYPDVVYPNQEAAIKAAVRELLRLHATGQPVLVVCSSINMSDIFSQILLNERIPHNVLNAYNIAKEAEIVSEAGRIGAVTIATAVAGRGTDIKLSKEVKKMGGLAVLGVGRMASRREELQARGRAGRQGDPGFSRFYVSPEDEVAELYGAPWLQKHRDGSKPIHSRRIARAILQAQLVCEQQGRSSRDQIAQFDDSVQYQRRIIYETRNRFMDECTDDISYYMGIEEKVLELFKKEHRYDINEQILVRYILDNVSYSIDVRPGPLVSSEIHKACSYIYERAERALKEKMERLPDPKQREEFFRRMTLHAIDDAWIEEIDFLQQLRQSVSGRRYAGRNVLYEYHEESYHAYEQMEQDIWKNMMRNILMGEVLRMPDGHIRIMVP